MNEDIKVTFDSPEELNIELDAGVIQYGKLQVGTTITGAAGTKAKVENVGSSGNAILNFTIPRGEKGDRGEKGNKGDAGSIKFIVVAELPTENIDESAIYMKPSSNQEENNTYEEFIYADGKWESLGAAQVKVDLEPYVTKEELNQLKDGETPMGSIVVEDIKSKNEFSINKVVDNFNSTYSITGDNIAIVSTGGYANTRILVDVEIGKTYTLSCNATNNQEVATNISIYKINGSDRYLEEYGYGANHDFNLTFTPTENQIIIMLYANATPNANNNTVMFSNMQLEKGTVATEYTPYKKFGYDNDEGIVVSSKEPTNGKVWLQKGKNLFNKDKTPIVDKFIEGGTGLVKPYYYGTKMFILEVQPNTTYTVSKIEGGHFRVGFSSVYPNDNVKLDGYIYNNNVSSITITTSSTTKYLCCSYWQTGVDTLDAESMKNSIQVEQGSIATEYEEYIDKKIYTKDNDGKYEEFTNLDEPKNNYSTKEHIVGTWIDGKTLYEITLIFPNGIGEVTSIEGKNYNLSDFGINNVDEIHFKHPTYYSFGGANIPFPFYDGNTYNVQVLPTILKIVCTFEPIALNRMVITLQYTKTTD